MSISGFCQFNNAHMLSMQNYAMPALAFTSNAPNFSIQSPSMFNITTPNTNTFSWNSNALYDIQHSCMPSPMFNCDFKNFFKSFLPTNLSNIFSFNANTTPAFNTNITTTPIFNTTNNTSAFSDYSFSAPTWTTPVFGSITTSSASTKTKNNPVLPELKSIGYNATKGKEIANEVKSATTGFNSTCGASVGNALNRAGVFDIQTGRHGYKYPDLLKDNPNFKEISTKNLDLSKLPAGCVLSYGRGVAGYDKNYGHVEITLGDGRAASDGITNNIRKGARVFVPVNQNLA